MSIGLTRILTVFCSIPKQASTVSASAAQPAELLTLIRHIYTYVYTYLYMSIGLTRILTVFGSTPNQASTVSASAAQPAELLTSPVDTLLQSTPP